MTFPVSHRLTLTVPELARVLGVASQSLYNHLDRDHDVIRAGIGEINIVRIGERVMVPKRPVAERMGITVADIDALFVEAAAS